MKRSQKRNSEADFIDGKGVSLTAQQARKRLEELARKKDTFYLIECLIGEGLENSKIIRVVWEGERGSYKERNAKINEGRQRLAQRRLARQRRVG